MSRCLRDLASRFEKRSLKSIASDSVLFDAQSGCILPLLRRRFHLNRDLTVLNSGDKRGMIVFGLVRVSLGKSSKCAFKHIASTQVAADLRGVAGAGMGTSKSPSTEAAILD